MRDFEKEYKNYIHEEVPDLWARIEAGLSEKIVSEKIISERENVVFLKRDEKINENEQSIVNEADQKWDAEKNAADSKKILYFIKRSMPAVAALCVLIIGIGVIRISNRAKSESTAYESVVAEDACDEAPMEECEAAVEEESMADEAVAEEAAAEYADSAEDAGGAAAPGIIFDETETADGSFADNAEKNVVQNATAGMTTAADDAVPVKGEAANELNRAEGIVKIEAATLIGIDVADSYLQDKGFAYVYRFRLADGSKIEMYLTQKQCDDLEKAGISAERQKKYDLEVKPYSDKEDAADESKTDSARCTLVKFL